MKNNIILLGGGGHAIACLDVIENLSEYNILGYLDIAPTKIDLPYLGNDDEALKYIQKSSFIICIGQIKNPLPRIKAFKYLKSLKAKLATIISPLAYVSRKAVIGEGTIVMHGAVIQANVKIGKNVIINDKALIEHDCCVEDNVHISTGSILNGGVTVKSGTFVGSGSNIINNVIIGESVVIGSGCVVLNNVSNKTVYLGVNKI